MTNLAEDLHSFIKDDPDVEDLSQWMYDNIGPVQEKLMLDLQNARDERDALKRKVDALESEIRRLVAESNSGGD